MRHNTIKALLIAIVAILFFAVAPSVSASAATGPTACPSGYTESSDGACLLPKDPSHDVTPPQGTVPLPVCAPDDPCTSVGNPDAPQPSGANESDSIVISIHSYNKMNDELYDAQMKAFYAGLGAIAASLLAVVLMVVMASMSRRHRKELESKQATPSYIVH